MGLWVTSLNSGSNGNCYYIGNGQEAVLVDAGLSCRETEKRMRQLDLQMDKVKAIFISHEHGDHIKGVSVLSAKYNLPVYITSGTLKHARLELKPGLVSLFEGQGSISVGNLSVRAFPKYHDAAEPHSFIVEDNGVCIGVFTDIGRVCDQVRSSFIQCHAVFLEANYDEALLEQGRYPAHLKNRIRGGNGHLSNREALELYLSEQAGRLSHLFLAHLSADNNRPELALRLFQGHREGVHVTVASRYAAMPVSYITAVPEKAIPVTTQLALF